MRRVHKKASERRSFLSRHINFNISLCSKQIKLEVYRDASPSFHLSLARHWPILSHISLCMTAFQAIFLAQLTV
jgi:hypothetical protein